MPRNEHACEPVVLARARGCRAVRPHPWRPGAHGYASCLRERGPGGRDRDDGSVFGGGLGGLLGQRVSYRCDDDRRFTASFQPFGQGISVDTGRRTYDLERRGSDRDRDRQEYRSRDGDVRLLVDGDEAELSIDGDDDFEDCEQR